MIFQSAHIHISINSADMTRHFQNHEGQKEKLLRLLKKRRKTHGVGGALLDTFSDPNGSLVLSNLE